MWFTMGGHDKRATARVTRGMNLTICRFRGLPVVMDIDGCECKWLHGMLLDVLSQASMTVVPRAAPTRLLAGIARLATMECLKTVRTEGTSTGSAKLA
jgi:hypothetical protein